MPPSFATGAEGTSGVLLPEPSHWAARQQGRQLGAPRGRHLLMLRLRLPSGLLNAHRRKLAAANFLSNRHLAATPRRGAFEAH